MDQKIRGITVTINGDTTGLGKALDTVKKQSIGLNRELKSVNKALNFNPSSASLLTEKQKVLADSVRAAREELKTLEAAQADVEKMYASGDIDRGAYLEFQRQLEAARANVERLQDQLVEFGGAAGQIMQQAGKKVSEFGSTVEGVGNKLMPISAATAAAGAATVKMAWDFEDSMAKVSTIADTTEVPLEDLQAAILELSDESGIAAGEIAENVYNAISAGQKTGDAVNFVRHATDLARAGFADSGNSLDLLTTIMNAYKLEANEVTNVSDNLIATQNLGKTTVAELSSSMGKIIPTANAANVSLDQLCAGYALMTANGVATAESTTYMNSMLNELNKSGSTVAKTLQDETGKGFSDLMAEGYTLGDVLGIVSAAADDQGLKFTDMFGSAEAAKAGLILLGNSVSDVENGLVEAGGSTSQFNEMLAGIQAGAGGTESALEKLETKNRKAQVAFNLVKNAALDFGQVASGMLAPYVEQFAGVIEKATDKLKNMDEGQKKAVITFAAVVAAAGPVLSVAGKGISIVGNLITTGGKIVTTFQGASAAMKAGASAFQLAGAGAKIAGVAITVLTSPITWIVAGIAALVAGFVLLYNHCEGFRNGVNAIASGIKTAWNASMDALKSTAQEKLSAVRTAYEENGGGIKGAAAAAMEAVKGAYTFGLTFIDKLTGGKLSAIAEKFKNSRVGQIWTSAMDGKLKIQKTVEGDGGLAGWEFRVTDAHGNAIDGSPFTSGEDGMILTANLLPGEYTVEELLPEDSLYQCKSENPQKISVVQGQTAEVSFVNALRPGAITVKKVDTTGSPLAGATFLLEWSEDGDTWQPVQYSEVMTKGGCSAKGLTEGCLTSGEDGVLQWTGLHPGLHYRLTEVKAPEGFKLLTETAFTGTVPADTLSVELTVVNARTFTMPETGAVSGAVLRVLGLAAAISCLCMLPVLSRKRH